jgi:hypothetical protein
MVSIIFDGAMIMSIILFILTVSEIVANDVAMAIICLCLFWVSCACYGHYSIEV